MMGYNNTAKPVSLSPDRYLRTPKTMILSILKLLEALLAAFALYLLLAEKSGPYEVFRDIFGLELLGIRTADISNFVQTVYNRAFTGIQIEHGLVYSFVMSELSLDYDTLESILRIMSIVMYSLVLLDGVAGFMLVWGKAGGGVISFVHGVRLFVAVCGLLWAIYAVGDTFVDIFDVAKTYKMTVFEVIDRYYDSIFYFLLLIGTLVGGAVVLIIYHANVLKIMAKVRQEVPQRQILSGTNHHLQGITAVIIVVYVLSAVITLIHVLGDGTELSELTSYIQNFRSLFIGKEFRDLAIICLVLLKYMLIAMCAIDFDRIHKARYNQPANNYQPMNQNQQGYGY